MDMVRDPGELNGAFVDPGPQVKLRVIPVSFAPRKRRSSAKVIDE